MSIVILGLAKTGTTGLYSAIKEAIGQRGEEWYFLFEPTKRRQLRSLRRYAPDVPLLTKAMVRIEPRLRIDYPAFEHRVMTVRDPRDIMVSHLLFRPLIRRSVVNTDQRSLDRFVALIREKETDPASHSMRELHARGDELGVGASGFGQITEIMDHMIALGQEREFHTVRYEDFVEGYLEELSDYLGFEVKNAETSSESWLGHIARSKSYGEWRDWFLPEDVEFFRPLFARFMEYQGYADEWDLPVEQHIDPSSASEHIAKKLGDRQRQVTERQSEDRWSPDRVAGEEEVRYLTERAEDGDALSAHRLAQALLHRSSRPADRREALRWAHRGAVQGHLACMELLADILRRGGEEDRWRAQFWAKQAAALRDGEARTAGAGQGPRAGVAAASSAVAGRREAPAAPPSAEASGAQQPSRAKGAAVPPRRERKAPGPALRQFAKRANRKLRKILRRPGSR